MKYQCPCCGFYTFEKPVNGSFDICEVCFWEDDAIQLADEDYSGGANRVSLRQARENYLQYGACEIDMVPYTRKPNEDELTGSDRSPEG